MENREKPESDSGSVRGERHGEGNLVRQLKNRHVAMIRYANQARPFNTRKESTDDFIS